MWQITVKGATSCGQWLGVTFRWCLLYKHNRGTRCLQRMQSAFLVATSCKDVNNSLCDETNRLVRELTIGHTQTHTNTNIHSTPNLPVSEQGVCYSTPRGRAPDVVSPVQRYPSCVCVRFYTMATSTSHHHHQETQTQHRQKHDRKTIRSWGYTGQKNSSDLLK